MTEAWAQPETKTEIIIETQDLKRVFQLGTRKVDALQGVNLQVKSGEYVALKGRSGSGKTTLLNCLCGLDRPTTGLVWVFGRDLSQLSDDELTLWRRREVGVIFQSFGLLPTLSAYENVELMLRLVGTPVKERRARVLYLLDLVGIARWMRHRPHEMSGGQQQRIGIARALANHPRLILADEPTGELDSSTAREILALFKKIVDIEAVTLVMSSHDPLVDEYVDRIVQLRDGKVIIVDEEPKLSSTEILP